VCREFPKVLGETYVVQDQPSVWQDFEEKLFRKLLELVVIAWPESETTLCVSERELGVESAFDIELGTRVNHLAIDLDCIDDGIGFPAAGVNGTGRGLKNMRERAQLLEGALVVEGTPNEGVTVVLTMPFRDRSQREG
jgi:light-regulated signal transduction histidine kinase (bacteriophytochrome)